MFCFPIVLKQNDTREWGELSTKEDDWQLHPFFDRLDKKRMSRTCNHIGLETKQAKEWRNFPANAIAIASNGSGDHLILLPEADNEKQLSEVEYPPLIRVRRLDSYQLEI